ncbi:hypothetical protein [Bowmanella sp. JS7-9]|uniref:Uncharacterized protein n=1 Tax=Pseudobowmanella zhangzhouensis TaxID=1537679 RepID=A0ABW1XNS8_9ALTE|nr:hypothetical protein [Bowmanella sp. JS7-9]TBX21903.1 hypothetical protein TK45_10440 [Bowmanella sp. JS7-9]
MRSEFVRQFIESAPYVGTTILFILLTEYSLDDWQAWVFVAFHLTALFHSHRLVYLRAAKEAAMMVTQDLGRLLDNMRAEFEARASQKRD